MPPLKVRSNLFITLVINVVLLCGFTLCASNPPRVINAAGNCTKLKCEKADRNGVLLQYMSGHAIENHTLTVNRTWHSKSEGEESDCLKGCISIPTCITVLVGIEERKCWFYEGDDVYAHPETIKPKQGYKIISLGNGVCKTQPCNNGKCIPNFDGTGRFTCSCDAGYSGDRCDQKGADLYFSFDKDTSHTNSEMSDFKMELVDAMIIRVPDRRGKVLAVKGANAVKISMPIAMYPDPGHNLYGAWLNNPWVKMTVNMTMSVSVKMDPSTDLLNALKKPWRHVLRFPRWSLQYNGATKIMKAYIGATGDPLGTAPGAKNVECGIEQIGSWTHVVVAMGTEAAKVKMYVNGELCDSKDTTGVKPDATFSWGADTWEKIIFEGNNGISLMDELKFFKSFPTSDEEVREAYLKEKKDFMS